jgi:N utilization substance protein A
MVELDNDAIKCMALFESLTNAAVRDCMINDMAVVFLVAKGELGRAIGKKGANITRVRSAFGRQVLVFEDSENIEDFIRSLFGSIPISNINIHDKMDSKTAYVTVAETDRGSAIGRGGERIKVCRTMLQRKFNCDLRLNSK